MDFTGCDHKSSASLVAAFNFFDRQEVEFREVDMVLVHLWDILRSSLAGAIPDPQRANMATNKEETKEAPK